MTRFCAIEFNSMRSIRTFCALLFFISISVNSLNGQTIGTFDPGSTPITLEQFGSAPGASITGPGVAGNFLLLTEAENGQNNFATFDRSDAGTYPAAEFNFDFLIDPTDNGPSADGFSFSFADTATYGTSGGVGSAPFTPEDPAAAGVLGFGFDTWSNEGAFDTPGVGTGSDYSEISVFYNGDLIGRIDDTRVLNPPLTLDDGDFATAGGIHNVTGFVNFAGGTVSLEVDGNSIFSDLAVPGLAPFESRIMLAARTGGENEIVALDNIVVNYVPEPTTGVFAMAGIALLFMRRRVR